MQFRFLEFVILPTPISRERLVYLATGFILFCLPSWDTTSVNPFLWPYICHYFSLMFIWPAISGSWQKKEKPKPTSIAVINQRLSRWFRGLERSCPNPTSVRVRITEVSFSFLKTSCYPSYIIHFGFDNKAFSVLCSLQKNKKTKQSSHPILPRSQTSLHNPWIKWNSWTTSASSTTCICPDIVYNIASL